MIETYLGQGGTIAKTSGGGGSGKFHISEQRSQKKIY